MKNQFSPACEDAVRQKVFLSFISILFMASLVIAWNPLFLNNLLPLSGNMIREHYPNWQVSRTSWSECRLPLWNPYRNMGEPLLADPKTMALYPLLMAFCRIQNYLFFFKFWIIFHTFLAIVFMYKLAYRWHNDAPAALSAAFIAGFNGFFFAHGSSPNLFAAAAYLPAVLFFHETGRPVLLGIALALQWLAGYPPFCFLSVLMIAWVAFPRGIEQIKIIFKAGGVALGLAAIQWLPFLDMLRSSSHSLLYDLPSSSEFSIPPLQLLKEIFVPQWIRLLPNVQGDRAIVTFYLGPLAMLLALGGTFQSNQRERWLAYGTFASILLSMGSYLPGYRYISLFRIFRFPASWLLIATAGLALLTSSGIAALRSKRWKWLAAGTLMLDLLCFVQPRIVAWISPSYLEDPPALIRTFKEWPFPTRIFHPSYFKQLWLKSTLETLDDYWLMKNSLTPSYGTAFGIREVNSYQLLRLRQADDYEHRLESEGPTSPLLQWAGVSTVVTVAKGTDRLTPDSLRILRVSHPKPPLFFTDSQSDGQVKLLSYRPGDVQSFTHNKQSGALVFTEAACTGWRTFIDQKPAPLTTFQNTFLAVVVPAGDHHVEFRYNPLSFWLGLIISFGTMGLGVGWGLMRIVRRDA